MYRSHLRLKCLKIKKFTIFSLTKIFTIHRFLKNAVCISMLIIGILLSLVCPTLVHKYNLCKDINTFKARSQTSVNKHNPTYGMCYCSLFLIAISTDMTKKDLSSQEIWRTSIHFLKVLSNDHLMSYFTIIFYIYI